MHCTTQYVCTKCMFWVVSPDQITCGRTFEMETPGAISICTPLRKSIIMLALSCLFSLLCDAADIRKPHDYEQRVREMAPTWCAFHLINPVYGFARNYHNLVQVSTIFCRCSCSCHFPFRECHVCLRNNYVLTVPGEEHAQTFTCIHARMLLLLLLRLLVRSTFGATASQKHYAVYGNTLTINNVRSSQPTSPPPPH